MIYPFQLALMLVIFLSICISHQNVTPVTYVVTHKTDPPSNQDCELEASRGCFHLLVVHRTSRFVHVVPQVSSRSLKKAIGFKTHVRYCDALMVLKSWIMSKVPFRSSKVSFPVAFLPSCPNVRHGRTWR